MFFIAYYLKREMSDISGNEWDIDIWVGELRSPLILVSFKEGVVGETLVSLPPIKLIDFLFHIIYVIYLI
jgi:hypothetical protein